MAWSKIRGHDRLVAGFAHVVRRQRLAHGYLFVGPDGVGKRLFARELAKALLCESAADTLEACDTCASCLLVEGGTHPDLFLVARREDKNELDIETMRELCAGFSLKTARGKGKVAILDDADDLNDEGANCFLKTLEEPPPRSVFILLGTGADQQLPTIVSRCQVVRFAPLPVRLVGEVLASHGVDDPAKVDRLVRLSSGSPGQALALAEDELWDFRRTLVNGLAQARVDSVGLGREFAEFVEGAGKETAPQRRRALAVLRLLVEAFTDAVALHHDSAPRSSDPDEAPLLRRLVERAGAGRILGLIERCLEAEVQLNRYVQIALVLEGLLDALGQALDEPAAARGA